MIRQRGRLQVAVFVAVILMAAVLDTTAIAACLRNVAAAPQTRPAAALPAAFRPAAIPANHVGLTFVGHASFLIESPASVRIVTDYNDYVRPTIVPDIVTMNNAHSTHFTDFVEAEVKHVLRGWDQPGFAADHSLSFRDVHIRNVPTNVREASGVRYNGNSIFVFEISGLCLAHLGHLHHRLTPQHLAALGQIDVLMVPVDGAFTLNVEEMIDVIDQILAPLIIPMHYFTRGGLERFLDTVSLRARIPYSVTFVPEPFILLSRATLPVRPEIRVLPGR